GRHDDDHRDPRDAVRARGGGPGDRHGPGADRRGRPAPDHFPGAHSPADRRVPPPGAGGGARTGARVTRLPSSAPPRAAPSEAPMPTFLPQDSLQSPRFCGIPTFMRLPHTRVLDGVDVAVVGIPFDTGSPFRVGCRFGPSAIRAMSLMLRPINPYHALNALGECAVGEYGGTDGARGGLPEPFAQSEAARGPLAARGVLPLGLGGDHSVALPELRGLGKAHGPLAVLHFD